MLLMAAEYRDEAAACLLDAQSLAPDEIRWPYYLGHLYKAQGETLKSTAAFEQALRLRPGDLPTAVWLADAYLDQGRPEAAEPLLNRVRAEQPRSAVVLFGLGRAALARSDYAGAVQHLGQALSLAPQSAVIHYPLAMAYRGTGDAEQSRNAHATARSGELRPPDPLMLELDSVLKALSRTNCAARRRWTSATGRRLRHLPQGHRAGAGRAVAAPQAGHGVVHERRSPRRVRAIRGRVAPVADLRQGALQPRCHAGRQRPSSAGDRTPVGGGAE